MSAPIKQFRLCADDEAEADIGKGFMCESDDGGDYVLHADHLASHAYDEAKERAAFEAQLQPSHCIKFADGSYQYAYFSTLWHGWLACAKSRAKAAGCE
jgi:hypothetical protein